MIEGVVVEANIESLARGIEYALNNIHRFTTVEAPLTWNAVAQN